MNDIPKFNGRKLTPTELAQDPFELKLKGGLMRYIVQSDRWMLYADTPNTLSKDSIGANEFKTIKEFIEWGQAILNSGIRLK